MLNNTILGDVEDKNIIEQLRSELHDAILESDFNLLAPNVLLISQKLDEQILIAQKLHKR